MRTPSGTTSLPIIYLAYRVTVVCMFAYDTCHSAHRLASMTRMRAHLRLRLTKRHSTSKVQFHATAASLPPLHVKLAHFPVARNDDERLKWVRALEDVVSRHSQSYSLINFTEVRSYQRLPSVWQRATGTVAYIQGPLPTDARPKPCHSRCPQLNPDAVQLIDRKITEADLYTKMLTKRVEVRTAIGRA